MRLLLSAIFAFLFLADLSAPAHAKAPAHVTCIDPFEFGGDNVKNLEAHTRAGQPCRIVLGWSANIDFVQIVTPPGQGVLGVSEKIGNRRYLTYVPRAGFSGRDRFEVYLRYTSFVRTFSTRLNFDMNVTR